MNPVTVHRRLTRAILVGATLLLAHPLLAEAQAPVTDPMGVVRIPKGAPIQIGAYWVMSGADTAMGIDSKRGAELAFRAIGNKLLGHPIKFNAEVEREEVAGERSRAVVVLIKSSGNWRARSPTVACLVLHTCECRLWEERTKCRKDCRIEWFHHANCK